MSEDRFKEVFRRLTSETPEPPRFADLETVTAKPSARRWLTPLLAAAGAAALVLVVVGLFGALGGGGPDLASPDDELIDYVRIEHQLTAEPECEIGSPVDNGGFDRATIEIWGPTSEDQWLMEATFPDGSTERMVVEGDPWNPDRAWAIDPNQFTERTKFSHVEFADGDVFPFLPTPYLPGFLPAVFLGPPHGAQDWSETLADAVASTTAVNGRQVTAYTQNTDSFASTFFVDPNDPSRLVGFVYVWDTPHNGYLEVRETVVAIEKVDADLVSFDTGNLTFIPKPGATVGQVDNAHLDCPVTIPSRAFTPPTG